eukprot:gene8837-6364_t
MVTIFSVTIFLCCLVAARSIEMELFPGDMRCIGQELDRLETVVFASSATSKTKDAKQKLTLKITDPDEEDIYFEKIPFTNKRVEFLYKVQQRGVYELCFELHDGKTPVRVFFHVDYKVLSEDGKDLSRQLSKDDVPSLQSELQSIERKIKEISLEIDHAKRQETFLNEANETTNSRLQWFSLLSIVVLLGTSAWQVIYLRRFFASKKLL